MLRNGHSHFTDVPSPPENLAVDGAWSRGVSLTWTPPRNNGNSPISNYVIQYWKEAGGNNYARMQPNRLHEEVISAAVTSHVLRDKLSPGTAYAVRLLGQNQFGRGQPSNSVKFMTKEEAPALPPIDISAETAGSTHIRVSIVLKHVTRRD